MTGGTAPSELRKIDGVVFGYESDGFEVTSLNRENFSAEVLLSAPDRPALRAAQGRAVPAFRYTVE
ncbi:hypothetical protein [Actinomadura decatromicini]|uniref:Uncharacterized protein n=1 Tax=Actinomadura decatromicini TaxID=2604572 RepID=A0A5D3FD26_9ACTN|nr:hypothetical protein [Actinomadura decatromicini]TYK45878.1 hypothetical protein FXF68_27010 [Actinomadura decatromicini]